MINEYVFQCHWEMSGEIAVFAKSHQEAVEMALSDDVPLPTDQIYVKGTFTVGKPILKYESKKDK